MNRCDFSIPQTVGCRLVCKYISPTRPKQPKNLCAVRQPITRNPITYKSARFHEPRKAIMRLMLTAHRPCSQRVGLDYEHQYLTR